jgi:hypothetical protein
MVPALPYKIRKLSADNKAARRLLSVPEISTEAVVAGD